MGNSRMIVYGDKDKSSAMFQAMLGENFGIDASKNTPVPHSPSANVNSDSKKQYKQSFKQWVSQFSQEETETWERIKTVQSVSNLFKDLGDKVGFKVTTGEILIATEVFRGDGSEIVLSVTQDRKSSDTSAILISEQGCCLEEYIEAQPSPLTMRKWIDGLVGTACLNDVGFVSDFDIRFDGQHIVARGNKKDCVRLKWALLDLLLKIYDEDNEWDE